MRPGERVRRLAKVRSPSGTTPQLQTRKGMAKKKPAAKTKSYLQAAGPADKGKTMPLGSYHGGL